MKWELSENGHCYSVVDAGCAEEALVEARYNVNPESYPESTSAFCVEVAVRCAETGEVFYDSVVVEPPVPECAGDDDHDWHSPQSLGGCRENPGVWGHGGGVIIHELCRICGAKRVTDTWADDGSGGHFTEVSYFAA